MGLGKTLMTICILADSIHDNNLKKTAGADLLLDCMSHQLIGHWHDEALKHCGDYLSAAIRWLSTP